jgi:hypothetical protein
MPDEQERSGSEDQGQGRDQGPTARIAELEARLKDLEKRPEPAELDAARSRAAELEAQLGTSSQERDEAHQRAEVASQRALEAHRRALLAENRGQVVDELVQGSTVDELDHSLDAAKQAYGRIADRARQQAQAERVPPGQAERSQADVDQLSPLQKIARGLTK